MKTKSSTSAAGPSPKKGLEKGASEYCLASMSKVMFGLFVFEGIQRPFRLQEQLLKKFTEVAQTEKLQGGPSVIRTP